ncbi:MAG: hypothetical protein LAP13_06020 [Acidobacteriia bacterium]|nr:hypothetical protein [Terriglobia bacterium]
MIQKLDHVLSVTLLVISSLVLPRVGAVAQDSVMPGPRVSGASAQALTPESLGMARTSMALISDRTVRLFNGRGSVSIRDKSVTGLQTLIFPPIEVRDYHFALTFRERTSKVLIQDVVPDVYEYAVRTGKGPHPLGLNFQTAGAPFVMLLQQAYWEPATYYRIGTFHKEFSGYWVSFGIKTKTIVSAEADEIYVEVELTNRENAPLALTVTPEQSAPEMALSYPNEKPKPAGPITHPDAFTLANNQIKVTVVSDLPKHTPEGWLWEIPARGKQVARFAIVPQAAEARAPQFYAPDITPRMERADQALRARLRWASGNLPRISTADKKLDGLYDRCILSVLESRWERENFVVKPFYAVGTWTFTIPWDTSYASEVLAILDPEGLREAFLTYIRAGLLKSSWVPWNGKANQYWYAQNPFAEMSILLDYLRQTGDLAFLDHTEEGATVFEWMKRMGREMVKRYGRPNGLLDFGAGSEKMLELRTDGYQHVVAASNGMAVEYFRQVAEWGRARSDPEAAQFDQWADQLEKSMNEKLWDGRAGWFDNLYPDGGRHQVGSYHLFDILDARFLSEAQRRRLISHLTEAEFLGPYGMYSISKSDRVHWDLEDVDWGGGGQYTGMPLRIAESLYRLGYPELAWNILSRCTRWSGSFPYIPQEMFADFLRSPEVVEMPLEIAAGSGVQAIVFGVFGFRPQIDGSLDVSPSHHRELGNASLTGYLFRGHSYDVVMDPWQFQVFRDGKLLADSPYGRPVRFPQP